jgi:hypothetical protein
VRRATDDASASYATEVARLLWPAPWETPHVTRGRSVAAHHRDAYLFPGRRRPRLLVPVDVPASSTMLQRLGRGGTVLGMPVLTLLQRSVGSPAFARTRWPRLRVTTGDPGAESIETHLSDRLGTGVRVGVLLGTRRPNQKPVLQLFGRDGRVLGYAKIGHNDLTARLVRREAAALAEIRGRSPKSFRAPELLHHGRWTGLEVLVMSALTSNPRRRVTPTARVAAMREVARLAGTTAAPLADTRYWARLRADAERLSPEEVGPRLLDAADALGRAHATDQVVLGSWHGDWGGWNMGLDDSGVVQLWDWERFDPQVPLGFDALHFAVQGLRPGRRDAAADEEMLLASVPGLLTQLGVPQDQHGLTLRLYLLEMAARYVDALTRSDTPQLRRRADWVLAFLERHLDHSRPVLVEGRP